MKRVKQISEGWLAKRREILSITRGQDAREALLAEIADAEQNLAAKKEIEAKAAAAGFRRSKYAGTCSKLGTEIKAGVGFVRNEGGKWINYSWDAVCDLLPEA